MKKLIALLVFVSAIQVTSASAKTSFVSGNTLLDWCEGGSQGACHGYLMAVSDILEDKYLPAKGCVPEGATAGQLKMIFINWANENPEHLHENGFAVGRNALIDGFGCSTGLRYVFD